MNIYDLYDVMKKYEVYHEPDNMYFIFAHVDVEMKKDNLSLIDHLKQCEEFIAFEEEFYFTETPIFNKYYVDNGKSDYELGKIPPKSLYNESGVSNTLNLKCLTMCVDSVQINNETVGSFIVDNFFKDLHLFSILYFRDEFGNLDRTKFQLRFC